MSEPDDYWVKFFNTKSPYEVQTSFKNKIKTLPVDKDAIETMNILYAEFVEKEKFVNLEDGDTFLLRVFRWLKEKDIFSLNLMVSFFIIYLDPSDFVTSVVEESLKRLLAKLYQVNKLQFQPVTVGGTFTYERVKKGIKDMIPGAIKRTRGYNVMSKDQNIVDKGSVNYNNNLKLDEYTMIDAKTIQEAIELRKTFAKKYNREVNQKDVGLFLVAEGLEFEIIGLIINRIFPYKPDISKDATVLDEVFTYVLYYTKKAASKKPIPRVTSIDREMWWFVAIKKAAMKRDTLQLGMLPVGVKDNQEEVVVDDESVIPVDKDGNVLKKQKGELLIAFHQIALSV